MRKNWIDAVSFVELFVQSTGNILSKYASTRSLPLYLQLLLQEYKMPVLHALYV